jgi:hypothetical protein
MTGTVTSSAVYCCHEMVLSKLTEIFVSFPRQRVTNKRTDDAMEGTTGTMTKAWLISQLQKSSRTRDAEARFSIRTLRPLLCTRLVAFNQRHHRRRNVVHPTVPDNLSYLIIRAQCVARTISVPDCSG